MCEKVILYVVCILTCCYVFIDCTLYVINIVNLSCFIKYVVCCIMFTRIMYYLCVLIICVLYYVMYIYVQYVKSESWMYSKPL